MKKKIFMLALSACLIVLSIAGSSLAYFTDVEEQSTVFTAGNVAIKLEFAQQDSNIKAYPNQKISNSAVITNEGSEDAFVGAIITLEAGGSDLRKIFSNDGSVYTEGENSYNTVTISNLLTGLVASSNDYIVEYTATTEADGKITGYTVYVLKNDKVAKNDKVKIFDGVTIPAKWDNKEMAVFNGLEISVKAYATQTKGFAAEGNEDTAALALSKAFTEWSRFTPPSN